MYEHTELQMSVYAYIYIIVHHCEAPHKNTLLKNGFVELKKFVFIQVVCSKLILTKVANQRQICFVMMYYCLCT